MCGQALPFLARPQADVEAEPSTPALFTPKEALVLAFVTEGFPNRYIAEQIGTSEQVVKNYMRILLDKSGMDNRLQLALWNVQRLHQAITDEANEPVVPTLGEEGKGD